MAAAATAPVCPWGFLAPLATSSTPQVCPAASSFPRKKTFAQALSNSCDIPMSQLRQPCLKGDAVAIKIPEKEYRAGLECCKNNLHGRLIMSKGDKPLRFVDLKSKLAVAWKEIGHWSMISLGSGFFEFSFSSLSDLRSVLSAGSWNIRPGTLRLSLWSPDFNPIVQRQSHAQCWVRIWGLPQEYWRSKIIFAIAGGIGVPIALDEATIKKTFGHFARVLVDLDLNAKVLDQILVEREGYAFFVGLEYENLPQFFSHYQAIGHSVENCRKTSKLEPNAKVFFHPRDKNYNPNFRKIVTKYIQKPANKDDLNVDKVTEVVHLEEEVADPNATTAGVSVKGKEIVLETTPNDGMKNEKVESTGMHPENATTLLENSQATVVLDHAASFNNSLDGHSVDVAEALSNNTIVPNTQFLAAEVDIGYVTSAGSNQLMRKGIQVQK